MAVWAIIEYNQSILFIKRSEGAGRDGQWCLPGGRPHKNEPLEVACLREIKEETGLDANILDKLGDYHGGTYFYCEIATKDFTINLKPNECSHLEWVQPQSLLKLGMIMNFYELIPILKSINFDVETF